MKRTIYFLLLLNILISAFAADVPEFDEFKIRIRKEHPRIFLTRSELPAFRNRAVTVCKEMLDELKKRHDASNEAPKLEIRRDRCEIIDGKMVFKRRINDQNAVSYGILRTGGIDAAECAILYLATGEEHYLRRAVAWLQICTEFCAIAERSEILPEWFHWSRLSAIVAYDWLYDYMTPEERKNFIVPMLNHVRKMQTAKYPRNVGGADSGNYGEPSLTWFAGLAAYGDGFDDQCAEQLLKKGYRLNCDMMNLREKISGGTGVLTSICTAYALWAYPWASYNFLHTLHSAAGISGSIYWSHMQHYPDFIHAMLIPDPSVRNGFRDFGWGDSQHRTNEIHAELIYTHLAQSIHFYGITPAALTVMNQLPPHLRRIEGKRQYPYTMFILSGFDPAVLQNGSSSVRNSTGIASYFPSFGLMNVRSGTTAGDTYASIKAGAREDAHQHYDENSFIIYRKGFQALDTGDRGNSKHHLVYYPQTIAHNTILIRMEKEPLAPYWYPGNAPKIEEKLFSDGGQYRRKAARSLGFSSSEYHAATGADATACYSPAKCRRAIRRFVYVKPDYFVIQDIVSSVRPEQEKVFLLHTANKPVSIAPGIWRSENGGGALFTAVLKPSSPVGKIIGGPGFEFFTNGKNFPAPGVGENGTIPVTQTNMGSYRLEISHATPAQDGNFITVLQAADSSVKNMIPCRLTESAAGQTVEFTTREGLSCTIFFSNRAEEKGKIRIVRAGKVLLEQELP